MHEPMVLFPRIHYGSNFTQQVPPLFSRLRNRLSIAEADILRLLLAKRLLDWRGKEKRHGEWKPHERQ